MRPLVVIFHQPAPGNFPCFIQCSEQVKIQDFCPVGPVEPFDKSILRRLPGLKIRAVRHAFGPLCQRHRDQFRPVVHPHFQRVAEVCHDPVQHPDDSLSRDIQVNFYRR